MVGLGRAMSRHEFGKITQQIYDSSLWFEGPVNRAIFMDSVILADSDDAVRMSLRAFAQRTGWSLEQVREAARVHMSPDPESRTQTAEGRRWLWVDPGNEQAGFRVVNRSLYKFESPDRERARKRAWARRDRQLVRELKAKNPTQHELAGAGDNGEAARALEEYREGK